MTFHFLGELFLNVIWDGLCFFVGNEWVEWKDSDRRMVFLLSKALRAL